MPIYEYRCSSCGHELEALQKLSEAPLTTCPSCSRDALVKLVSAAGFQLKGSGWYATDFKSNGKKPSSKPAEASGDSKPADSASDSKSSEGNSEKAAAPSCGANCSCH